MSGYVRHVREKVGDIDENRFVEVVGTFNV